MAKIIKACSPVKQKLYRYAPKIEKHREKDSEWAENLAIFCMTSVFVLRGKKKVLS